MRPLRRVDSDILYQLFIDMWDWFDPQDVKVILRVKLRFLPRISSDVNNARNPAKPAISSIACSINTIPEFADALFFVQYVEDAANN
jgi:hypothetical protein